MPLIAVSVLKGVLSRKQETQILWRLTDSMVTVEARALLPSRGSRSLRSRALKLGSRTLTIEDIKVRAAGKTPVASG